MWVWVVFIAFWQSALGYTIFACWALKMPTSMKLAYDSLINSQDCFKGHMRCESTL